MKKNWKFFLIIGSVVVVLSGLVLVISLISAGSIMNDNKNEIAAIVNSEKIYVDDIEKIYKDFKEHGISPIPDKKKILNDIINELLVVQEAKSQNIIVNDKEVENRVKMLKEHMPELYDTVLEKVSLEEYKERIKEGMLYQKMKENVLKDNLIYISEEAVLAYIEKNKKDFSESTVDEDKFDEVKNIIKEMLKEREEIKIFNQWIEKLKDKAEIKIYFVF